MRLERRIWHLGTLFTVLLVLLSTRIVYWQLLRGDELQPVALDPLSFARRQGTIQKEDPQQRLNREALRFLIGESETGEFEGLPQPVVQRTRELLANISRGTIYDRDGQPLAYDEIDGAGERVRTYSDPSLVHVTGYVSGLRTGIAGLELSYNNTLLGLDRPLAQLERLVHQPISGSSLYLTIDSQVQQAAVEALAGRPGAVVALDGRSGAVLAMASAPTFDPNRVQEAGYISNLLETCGDNPDCQGIFLNRATQALYPPGSTWKTVTLIAALDSGLVTPDTVFDFGEPVNGPNGSYYVYEVDGGVIPDPNHKERELELPLAFAKSANAAFARMADEMGGDTLLRYAQPLGFSSPEEEPFPLEIPYTGSQLANQIDSLRENNLLRAATGIGQGELLVSPLNMAMVVLSVLNGGDMPVPYLVDRIDDPSGIDWKGRVKGRVIRNIYQESTAETTKEMLKFVVDEGSGSGARVPGLVVGGKTGTAQLDGQAQPHAWFFGFAEDGERSVAIAVVVENGGQGYQVAAPIFARVAGAAFQEPQTQQ
jgi:peptidoglycan glycosyltransferase